MQHYLRYYCFKNRVELWVFWSYHATVIQTHRTNQIYSEPLKMCAYVSVFAWDNFFLPLWNLTLGQPTFLHLRPLDASGFLYLFLKTKIKLKWCKSTVHFGLFIFPREKIVYHRSNTNNIIKRRQGEALKFWFRPGTRTKCKSPLNVSVNRDQTHTCNFSQWVPTLIDISFIFRMFCIVCMHLRSLFTFQSHTLKALDDDRLS